MRRSQRRQVVAAAKVVGVTEEADSSQVEHLKWSHDATLLMILTLVIDRRIWAGHTRVDGISYSRGGG
jgi:hypothetical protein